jgi:SSS family solute:Na+ symporter
MEYVRPRATAREEVWVSRIVSLLVKFGAAAVVLVLSPSFSLDLQTIGGVIVLQVLPTVFFGVMTGWFHRWALMIGMLFGLASSMVLLYKTPKVFGGVVVGQHFGGSTWPLSRFGLHTDLALYTGLITLAANLLIVVVLTAVLKLFHVSPNLDHTRPEDYLVDGDAEGLDRLADLLDGVPNRTGAHALR